MTMTQPTRSPKFQHGFVLGKFMPLHAGIVYLMETARAKSETLTVLLCSRPDDPIPGDIRFEWLVERFPEVDMVHHPEPLPRDQNDPHFWDLWCRAILEYCPGRQFDAVFSSEAYGSRLAHELQSVPVQVDLDRLAYPVSGTDIRRDPV